MEEQEQKPETDTEEYQTIGELEEEICEEEEDEVPPHEEEDNQTDNNQSSSDEGEEDGEEQQEVKTLQTNLKECEAKQEEVEAELEHLQNVTNNKQEQIDELRSELTNQTEHYKTMERLHLNMIEMLETRMSVLQDN